MNTTKIFDYIHNQVFGKELVAQAQALDPNANGIQILGKNKVNKIAVGVSCHAEFLQKAIDWGADVCIFHHGMGLSEKHGIYNSRLSPSLQSQLQLVFKNNLTIAAYHYCLDVDPNIGNNVLIAQHLGLRLTGEKYFDDWGIIAKSDPVKDVDELAKACSQLFKHDVFMIRAKNEITRIGICSGGAIPHVKENFEIVEKNIDLHLTGVATESGVATAKENDYSYFACGHYATETLGIKALGEKINTKFENIDVRFIEVWNEL